jgi:hypothetical protein
VLELAKLPRAEAAPPRAGNRVCLARTGSYATSYAQNKCNAKQKPGPGLCFLLRNSCFEFPGVRPGWVATGPCLSHCLGPGSRPSGPLVTGVPMTGGRRPSLALTFRVLVMAGGGAGAGRGPGCWLLGQGHTSPVQSLLPASCPLSAAPSSGDADGIRPFSLSLRRTTQVVLVWL